MSIDDHPAEPRKPIRRLYMPSSRLMYALGDFMIGGKHPESTTNVIGRLNRPLLLIACGRGHEQACNRLFYRAARDGGAQAALWELPHARHAGAFNEDFREYQRRIVYFFNSVDWSAENNQTG